MYPYTGNYTFHQDGNQYEQSSSSEDKPGNAFNRMRGDRHYKWEKEWKENWKMGRQKQNKSGSLKQDSMQMNNIFGPKQGLYRPISFASLNKVL